MSKVKALEENTTAATVNMSKYADSKEIDDRCVGCNKIFDWIGNEGIVTIEKCLAYSDPSSKWPDDKVGFATHEATVLARDAAGKPIKLEQQEIPVIEKMCPLASHVKPAEIVEDSGKTRAGQQKQKKR